MSDRRTLVLYSPARSVGGAERILLTQAGGLARRGWRPIIVHEDRPVLERAVTEARAAGIGTTAVSPVEGRWPWRTLLDLWLTMRRVRPAVVQAHLGWPGAGLTGLLAATLAGVPTILVTVHLWLPPSRRVRWWHGLLGRRIAGYVAVSEAVAEGLRRDLGIDPGRIEVVPNGIDVARFAASRDVAEDDVARGGVAKDGVAGDAQATILAVAQLRAQKRLDLLVEAAADLPGVRVVIAGEGPGLAGLRDLARAHGVADRIEFAGFVDDVRPLLGRATLLVLPSDAEGLPLTVLEAMAAGVPVVATDVPGTREVVIDGRTGVLVPPGDAHALAGAIDALLRDEGARTVLTAEALAVVRARHDAEAMVDRVADILARHATAAGMGARGDAGGEERGSQAAGARAAWPGPVDMSSGSAPPRSMDWRYLTGRVRYGGDDDPEATVTVASSPAALRDAASHLGQGATLVARRSGGWQPRMSPEPVIRAAGLDVVGRWTAWPGDRVRRWIPVGSPEAEAWLATEVRGTTRALGLRRLRSVAWGLRRRVGAAPDVTVARRASRASDPGRLDRLIDEACTGLGIDPGPPILLAHGRRPENKVVLLLIPRGDARPHIAVKIPRASMWNERSEREAAVLRSVAALGAASGRDLVDLGVPAVLGTATLEDGALAIAETALSGPRLSGLARRIGFAPVAALGSAWLRDLAEATARPAAGPDPRMRAADALLDGFAAEFTGALTVVPERRAALLEALRDLPVVVEHRDTAPWNLLDRSVDGVGRLGAVDWESSEADGWPGLDLAYFLLQVAIDAGGARTVDEQLAAARRLRDPGDPIGRAAGTELERYAAALGLEVERLEAIRPLAWAIHARSEHRRAAADHGSPPPTDVLGRGLYARLWSAEA